MADENEENVKGKMLLALDTNSIIKYFERLLSYMRGKYDRFRIPEECLFLKNNEDKLELFISVLNQAEVFRNLKSEWGCSDKEIEAMWGEFMAWLPLKIIDEVVINAQILKVTKSVALKKKTIVNFIHLQVAKELNLWFYTGDEQIKEKGKSYYGKILDYPELKKILVKAGNEGSMGGFQLFSLFVPFSLLIILSSMGLVLSINSLVDITLSGTKTLTSLLFNFIIFLCIIIVLIIFSQLIILSLSPSLKNWLRGSVLPAYLLSRFRFSAAASVPQVLRTVSIKRNLYISLPDIMSCSFNRVRGVFAIIDRLTSSKRGKLYFRFVVAAAMAKGGVS